MSIFERTFGIVLALAVAALAEEEPLSRAELEKIVREQGAQIAKLEDQVDTMGKKQDARSRTILQEDIDGYLEETGGDLKLQSVKNRRVMGKTTLGGYFSLEFFDRGPGEPMTFDQHRLVLLLQSQIANGIAFVAEIEFEGGGADVSFLTGNEILVEYAELSFELWDDRIVFAAGIILVPWGRFNFFHDDPMQDLTMRPLVARRIAAVAFGSPGVAVEGTLEFGQGWFFDYDVALVQGFKDGFSTNGGARGARNSFREDNNDNKQVFGRFVFSPPTNYLDFLEFGGSGNYGKHSDDGSRSNYGWAVELFMKKGPFQLVAEYMNQRIEQASGAAVTEPRRQDGWYVDLMYEFFPASWRGKHVLFTDESVFTLVVRVEAIDLNEATTGTTFRDDLAQYTLGFNFRPVERTVFKISYTWVDSKEVGSTNGIFAMSWASYF